MIVLTRKLSRPIEDNEAPGRRFHVPRVVSYLRDEGPPGGPWPTFEVVFRRNKPAKLVPIAHAAPA